jgi:hypothetical protein
MQVERFFDGNHHGFIEAGIGRLVTGGHAPPR